MLHIFSTGLQRLLSKIWNANLPLPDGIHVGSPHFVRIGFTGATPSHNRSFHMKLALQILDTLQNKNDKIFAYCLYNNIFYRI